MALPVFDAAWRGQQRLKPPVCVLEVRDRAKPDGEPIARLFVQREESYRRDERDGQMYEASISLSYQTIEPKHSFRSPVSGSFDASYSRGFFEGEASVSLVDGALFFDPAELRGQRIGTYLMNEIVTWAQQWPEAKVGSIKLVSGQAQEDNRFAPAPLALALRNTFRHRLRLASTLLLLAGAGAMFITSMDLRAAWEDKVRESAADRHFDLEIGLQAPADAARVAAAVAGVAEVRHWEAWSAVSASVADDRAVAVQRSYPDGAHGGFALRSAPVDTALMAHRLAEGRWLKSDDRDALVVNTQARSLAFRQRAVGDWVTLVVAGRAVRLQLVGVVNEALTPGAAYVTPATFDQATQRAGQVNALRFVLADRTRVEAVSRALVQALEVAGAGVRVSITEQRFAAAQGGHVYILVAALGFIACTMAVVGLLGLASTLGTAVAERTREFGVLRALGARSAAVLQTVVFEGLCIALLSWGLAVLLSLPLSARVGQVLASIAAQSLVLRLSPPGALLWLVLLLGGAALVSWHPARRASRLTVRQTLAF